jgi:ABC-2 type transport system ATP-binding protein
MADDGTAAVVVRDLVRKFDGFTAVDGVSFEVQKGEVFGFLGPNGAGKTTTINMLCTLLRPSGGEARVWGHDIVREPDLVRRSLGLVFQDPAVDEELTGHENMWFHGRIYKVDPKVMEPRIEELLTMVELWDRKDDQVKTYSGGMKRRLEIARGLLHHPEVLFLDEPTIGLDPQTRRHIWEYIRRLNQTHGVTIFLTTHYMEEADALSHRVAIIDHGRIVAMDTPAALKASLGGDVVLLRMRECTEGCIEALRAVPGITSVERQEEGLILAAEKGDQAIPLIFEVARAKGLTIDSVVLKIPTLEDVFIKYTGRGIRDEKTEGIDQFRARGRRMRSRRAGRMH